MPPEETDGPPYYIEIVDGELSCPNCDYASESFDPWGHVDTGTKLVATPKRECPNCETVINL